MTDDVNEYIHVSRRKLRFMTAVRKKMKISATEEGISKKYTTVNANKYCFVCVNCFYPIRC